MPKFKYKALKENKTFVDGEVEAASLREAREKIRTLGFVPTKVYTEKSTEQKNIIKSEVLNTVLTLSQKISFTSELQLLLSSGIPILDALQSIETNAPDKKLCVVCAQIKEKIMSGMTFAQALDVCYSKTFGPVYIGLVKTGEDSGELEITLDRMLLILRKQDFIKNKIINASIYPSVLIAMMIGVLILFAKFVFPAFAGLMAFNGQDLPILAQSVIGVMNFLNKFWWLVLISIGAFCGALMSLFQEPKIKSGWDNFILKIPVISTFIEYVNLANFMTVLQISYDAGLPIVSGLELASKTVGNYTIKSKIFNAINLARGGKNLTDSFRLSCAIPDAFLSMIAAGEKSGTLGKMLNDVAKTIDKKVDIALEAMVRLFEPTVMVILGGMVLFIAIAFYQAYVGMLGSLF